VNQSVGLGNRIVPEPSRLELLLRSVYDSGDAGGDHASTSSGGGSGGDGSDSSGGSDSEWLVRSGGRVARASERSCG
jgi:hypothetical protein